VISKEIWKWRCCPRGIMFVCVLCDGGEEKRERVWRESQTDGAKRYPAVPRGHEKSPPTTKHVVNHLSSPQYIVYPLLLRRRQSHQNRFLLKRRHFLIERLAFHGVLHQQIPQTLKSPNFNNIVSPFLKK
jgi:hypothetical protein